MDPKTSQRTQDRSTALVNDWRAARKRRLKRAQLPWWRQPPVGYIFTFPLVGVGLLIPFSLQHFNIYKGFLDTPFVLVTLIIALIWGTEPAVLSILLGTAAFDIYFLPPPGTFIRTGPELLPLVLFILAEILMVVLAAQRERGRRNIEFAQQELRTYAGELERVNQELEKADKLKDHFLSMASHELKTPITSIRGHAQLGMLRLAKQTEVPSDLAPLGSILERIDQQTHRLHSLVDDLLDLSILRSGKMTLRPEQCNVEEVCREIIADEQSLSGRKIELEVPASAVVLQADCERLGQVITNLVTNAIKYSPDNSAIQVRVSQSKNTAAIQVHNEGKPIPKEQQANIFEPFYRTPDAQSSSKKGWGLGLAITKQIVERHGGRIKVESSEGKGTTFKLEMPVSSRATSET